MKPDRTALALFLVLAGVTGFRAHAGARAEVVASAPSAAAPLAPKAPVIVCTPEGYFEPGGAFQIAEHPIVAALERAVHGGRIVLQAGDYEPFTIGLASSAHTNSKTKGGTRASPLVIDGRGVARIIGRQGDAIGIDQSSPCSWITFRGLEIQTGRRSGVLFYKRGDGRDHVGFAFEDCKILGGFNHATGTGRGTKWGLWAHRLRDFRFVGVTKPAEIRDIRDEHAFYLQNPQGLVLIENVEARNLGRTFLQVTCRATDGPPGKGRLTVKNCRVADVGLALQDNYRGGSAFTLAGRHMGRLEFEDNVYRGGFNERIRKLKPPGAVHGTGAFVAWQGGERQRNGTLVLKNNDFRIAYGCGDRAVVAITGCDVVRILGRNHFESGGFQPALALEPLDDQGRPAGEPNQNVGIVPATKLVGTLTLRNEDLTKEGLGRFDIWKDEEDDVR